jgi:hypothetical protein
LPASTDGQFSPRASRTGAALEVLRDAVPGEGEDGGGDGPDDAWDATDVP